MQIPSLITSIVMYAIEIAGIAATINGILASNITSLFAGILLYITMRTLEEKQASENIRDNVLGKINLETEGKGDENFWLMLQLILVIAVILLATL